MEVAAGIDAELRRGVAKPASESRKPTGHGRFREQSACQHEAREKTLKPALRQVHVAGTTGSSTNIGQGHDGFISALNAGSLKEFT